jgi:hypothetical protein
MEKYTESMIRKALSIAYDKAINGFEVQGFKILDSSFDLAKDYSNPDRPVKKNATSLINQYLVYNTFNRLKINELH